MRNCNLQHLRHLKHLPALLCLLVGLGGGAGGDHVDGEDYEQQLFFFKSHYSVTFYIQKAVQGRFPSVWEKRFLSLWQKAARPDNGEKSFCTFWGFTAIRSRNFCQFSVICGYFDVCCSSPDSTRC